ncbi:MAG: hypothetical protein ACSLE1_15815 [Sphingobium sp.]
MFGWVSKRFNGPTKAVPFIPSVQFDSARVTKEIRSDLWDRVHEFEDLPFGDERTVYEAALAGIIRGRDVGYITEALTDLGMGKDRSAYIALYLCNRSSSLMNTAQMLGHGITEGKWLYSGARCHASNPPSYVDRQMDEAHRSANDSVFSLKKGLWLDGSWQFPGMFPGCKCATNAVIDGFD